MTSILKRKFATALSVTAAALLLLGSVNEASAHTTRIGWSNGAAAGQVNLFMGTYHQDNIGDGPNIEGTAHLTGPGGFDVLEAFTTAYTNGALPANLLAANVQQCGGSGLCERALNSWEGVTISGLTTPGIYNFDYICVGCSAHWTPISNNIQFDFSAVDLGGGGGNVTVPEPTSMALVGLSLLALGWSRRKQA